MGKETPSQSESDWPDLDLQLSTFMAVGRRVDCTLVQLSDHRRDGGEKAGEEAEDGWAAEPSSTLNT